MLVGGEMVAGNICLRRSVLSVFALGGPSAEIVVDGMVPPHRLPLLGPEHRPLHEVVDAEVYPDDGYHADEAGGQAAVEGADALLPEYPGASVNDALVRYGTRWG